MTQVELKNTWLQTIIQNHFFNPTPRNSKLPYTWITPPEHNKRPATLLKYDGMDVVWIGFAYLFGLAVSLVGLPPLVGYLAVGFVLSVYNFDAGPLLHELAHVGVLLLLFTVGLKLRLRSLLRPEVWAAGGIHFAVITALFTITLALLGLLWQPSFYLAAGLAFSSTVLAAKVLEEKRELGAFHGRVAMGVLIFQDLIAVALMATLGAADLSLWSLALFGLIFLRPLIHRFFALSGHQELLLLFGVVLALSGAWLFESFGLSSELGAIVMGALLAGHKRRGELARTLWSLKEVFLVAFFVEVGLAGLPGAEAVLASLLLLILLPLKATLFFILFLRHRLRARNAFLAALALASYSEFGLISAQVAVDTGILPASSLSILALSIALSFVFAAPLNRFGHGIYGRFEHQLVRLESAKRHPDQQPISLGSARILIVGMGRTGRAAYKSFRDKDESVVGFDSDPAQLEYHRHEGYRVLYGDAEDPELWSDLQLEHIELILLTMPDLEAKLRSLGHLRQRGFTGVIAATSFFPEEDQVLEKAGVSLLFNPLSEAGARLARLSMDNLEQQLELAGLESE